MSVIWKEIQPYSLISILLLLILACNLPVFGSPFEAEPTPAEEAPAALTFETAQPGPATEAPAPATGSPNGRSWPDTSRGIHVFNDQLATVLSDAQLQFAATRYDGTQKMPRSQANTLRAINPDFMILNYRLGLGIGYRGIQEGCQPTGEWLAIVQGDEWVQEWPGEKSVLESWFYHWPEGSTQRVINCDWGWYLVDPENGDFRTWWQASVLQQVQDNDADGIFLDSISVPNYMGADRFVPALPDIDEGFEAAWAGRIHDWLAWLQEQPLGQYALVPNVGSWINNRDTTDYSPADGAMLEGFALEADQSPLALEDWKLQMNRALAWLQQGKALITQTYVMGDAERMFATGSYLLVKGDHTYLNIELDLPPEWWPEYEIAIGEPLESAGGSIDDLYLADVGVYRRDFDNGFVLVNPTNPWAGSGQTVEVDLGGQYSLATGHGGGEIGEDGNPIGELTYTNISKVSLPPFSAAVLLNSAP